MDKERLKDESSTFYHSYQSKDNHNIHKIAPKEWD